MRRTYERGIKARLSFSGAPHANMADRMEEVNVGGKTRWKRHVCCAGLRCISYAKFSQILEVLRDFHRLFGSRNSPTTGISILFAMFTGACGPLEKLSLALVPRSNVLRMIVKLACQQEAKIVLQTFFANSSSLDWRFHFFFFFCNFLLLFIDQRGPNSHGNPSLQTIQVRTAVTWVKRRVSPFKS